MKRDANVTPSSIEPVIMESPPQEPPVTDLIGQTIGQYQLIELVGEGMLSHRVYKAFQLGLNRYVALKLLASGRTQQDTDSYLKMFAREADVLAKLSHPHIAPVYDYGTDKGWVYFAEEFVEKGTLARRLHSPSVTETPLSLLQKLRLLVQAAQALDYAHGLGILHRDLRPSNMLLRSDDYLLVTNFGVTRHVLSSDYGSLDFGEAYKAPEQLENSRRQGSPTDVYGLPVPHPRTLDPTIPLIVEEIVVRALEKEPKARYTSAAEMAQALESAAERVARGAHVFVSHSHEDADFCRAFTAGLCEQGFDVWYDEQNLGSGSLRREIEAVLATCEHFVVVMSPAAVASDWVNAEIDAALHLLREGRLHSFIPVVAHQCDIPLLLQRYMRIEGPNSTSIAADDAVLRTAQLLTGSTSAP